MKLDKAEVVPDQYIDAWASLNLPEGAGYVIAALAILVVGVFVGFAL